MNAYAGRSSVTNLLDEYTQAYANRAVAYSLSNKLAEAPRDAEQAVRSGVVPAAPTGDSDSPDREPYASPRKKAGIGE